MSEAAITAPTPDEIARIAKKLTPNQQQALMWLHEVKDVEAGTVPMPKPLAWDVVSMSYGKKGRQLTKRRCWGDFDTFSLTPLGAEVRAILSQQETGQ